MKTNNIIRLLQSHKMPFTTFELPVEKISAIETAQLLGVEPSMVYKTIVVKREKPGKPILAVVPGNHEVNLKRIAETIKEKKVILTTQREAENLTKLKAGGISPLALLGRGFQILIDISALQYEQIHISGGERGLNIRLPVQSLIDLTDAQVALISSNSNGQETD